MSVALNGTKWWTDRARMLESQRATDVPRIAELEAEVARLRERISFYQIERISCEGCANLEAKVERLKDLAGGVAMCLRAIVDPAWAAGQAIPELSEAQRETFVASMTYDTAYIRNFAQQALDELGATFGEPDS